MALTSEHLIHDIFDPEQIPNDLIVILVWVALSVPCCYYSLPGGLQVILGLPLVLFIPGYALIAALFPAIDELDGIERVALSFGLSIAVVPLIGLGLNYTPWGIRLEPILASLTIFITGMTLITYYRRLLLPREQRFHVPFRAMLASAQEELYDREASKMDRALSIILIISIVVAIGTTIFVIVVPKEGEHFTEFFILGEGGKASDYPTDFRAGTPQTVIIGVGNHEFRDIGYTVECLALTQTFDESTNISVIQNMVLMDRFVMDVPHNSTEKKTYTFTLDNPEYNRVEFLLFNETVAPDTVWGRDRITASYRDLHLWTEVRSPV